MRLWLKLHKFTMGWAACGKESTRQHQCKISDDELFWEWQRLHYLFIWPLYNIVNCDVLKWIQTRGSVMRTYWISVRGRLNPPGSPHTSHPASLCPRGTAGGKWHHPACLLALWRSSIKIVWQYRVYTKKKHKTRTSKQLSRGAPTPIKLDPWRCPPICWRDVLELKHNTAWSALNGSWMQELADEQSLPCL